MKKFVIAFVFITFIAVISQSPANGAGFGNEVIFKDTVTAINRHELYMSGLRFFLSPKVKIFLKTDNGQSIPLKTLVNVGRIDRASVYVKGSQVYKIIVLDMKM